MITPFRARPLPASTAQPESSPKMSKAAMLRQGLTWTPPLRSVSSTSLTEPPPQRFIPAVASLNPPVVAPRPTKASSLRTEGTIIAPVPESVRVRRDESEIFSDTPGHSFRRRSLLIGPISSIATPKTLPRPTKSSALRTGEDLPNSRREKKTNESQDLFEGIPGHPRNRERFEIKSIEPPELEVRPTRASMLRALGDAQSLGSSGAGCRPGLMHTQIEENVKRVSNTNTFEGVPGHKRSIPVPVAVLQKKPITKPRLNRAAELRGVNMGICNSRSSSSISISSGKRSESGQSLNQDVDEPVSQARSNSSVVTREEEEEEEGYGTVVILKKSTSSIGY